MDEKPNETSSCTEHGKQAHTHSQHVDLYSTAQDYYVVTTIPIIIPQTDCKLVDTLSDSVAAT